MSIIDDIKDLARIDSNKYGQIFDDKTGVQMYVMDITPDIAKLMISINDSRQRRLKGSINTFAKDMNSGNWDTYACGSIKFCKSGTLIDGQNRLTAIIKSGETIKSVVCFDLDDGAFDKIDTGLKRTGADVLSRYPNALALSAFVRAKVIFNERGIVRGLRTISVQNHVLVENLDEEKDQEIVRLSRRVREKMRIGSGTAYALMRYITLKIDKDMSDAFYNDMLDCEKPKILIMCREMENKNNNGIKMSLYNTLLVLIQAWNSYYNNASINLKNIFSKNDTSISGIERIANNGMYPWIS